MNELKVFNNPEFGKVRTVEINGEPWLVGKDVAAALGYQNPQRAIRDHVDEEDKGVTEMVTPGGKQSVPIINESGLYSLVLSSKLPGAKKFRRWVTSEVLPSIRKTGHYTAKPMTDYQMESIRVRKAQLLERLAKEYDGTYRQVLQAHATKELTGEYLLPLPYIGEKTYSAQEIGEKLGISANKVGMLANRNHLKTKQYGTWVNDVAKNCPGKEVPSFRYYESVVPVLKTIISKQ
jgi:prophage antirepressor-like protein